MTHAASPLPMSPSRASSAAAWGSVALLVLFSQLSIMDRQIIALLIDPIKADLGFTDTQMGLLQGLAFALMYAIAGLPIGWAVDRYPRRFIIYAGITIWSIAAACCGLARNFVQFFLARSAVGAGEATVAPVAVSLISDLFPADKVGRALGVYSAGYPIGTGIALLIGGWIIGLFAGQAVVDMPLVGPVAPWQAVFIITGAPGLLFAFLAFVLTEPPRAVPQPSSSEQPAFGMKQLMAARGRVILFGYLGFTLSTLVAYAVAGWTPAYLGRVHGWESSSIGWTFGLTVGVGGVAGSLLGGMLIDMFHRRGHEDASLYVGVICSILSLPFLVGAYFVASPYATLVLIALGLTTFQANGPAAYATWRMVAPPHLRGRVTVGFVFLASLFGTTAGPLAVGLASDHLFRSELLVGMSIALVLAVTLPLMAGLLIAARRAFASSGSIPA